MKTIADHLTRKTTVYSHQERGTNQWRHWLVSVYPWKPAVLDLYLLESQGQAYHS